VGDWVDLTRWMYVARGGGGAGSWRAGERHRVMIVESIFWGAFTVYERIGEPMAKSEEI
jgi:hypothetical protein